MRNPAKRKSRFIARRGLFALAALSFCLIVMLMAGIAQETRTKAAEGAFSVIATGREGEFRRLFDEWVLWKTREGYQLETTMYLRGRPQISPAREILYLSDRFHIEGFSAFPVAWDPPVIGSYDCHLKPLADTQRLQCDYSIHNKQGAGNIALPAPYIFEISVYSVNEDPEFDLPFSFASIVQSAPRDPKQSRTIPLVYLKVWDADDGDPNHVTVVADRTEYKKVRFVGRESIKVLHKQVDALKFQLDDTHAVWTSENGMPLAVAQIHYANRWELTRFHQYERVVPGLD